MNRIDKTPKCEDSNQNRIMKKIIAFVTVMIVAAGCDVENPGPIAESSLNSEEAVPGIVVGMSSDLSVAVSITTYWSSVWSDELIHSGTFAAPTVFSTGEINSEDVDPWWDDAQRARWVAESGIERLQNILGEEFDDSEYAARANLYAGYANRILGEHSCDAVIDGGGRQDYTIHFERAEDQFTQAMTIAETVGNGDLRTAAIAGRASVKAALGDWSGAVSDAGEVPVDYTFEAIYSLNSGRENNGWPANTIERGELSVWGTPWEDAEDPRLPQEVVLTADGDTATAANGTTPWITQLKHETDADNIALSKGTEMLLIRAEAELRGNQNVGNAMDLINEARDYNGLDQLTASNIEEAWGHLQNERGATLWLEGRRFWDLRRWNQETGPANHPFLDGRDSCVPIGSQEINNNPNL